MKNMETNQEPSDVNVSYFGYLELKEGDETWGGDRAYGASYC